MSSTACFVPSPRPARPGQVINVATGSRISLNELFATMRDADRQRRRRSPYGPPRAGDVKDSLADITRARTLLGYEPMVSFQEGLRQTVDWYRHS